MSDVLPLTTWRSRIGDDPTFASPAYDDAGWESVADLGGTDPAGIRWYRAEVHVPAGDEWAIAMPSMVGAYELYADGAPIGSAGHIGPEGREVALFTPSVWTLPAAEDGTILLALRVEVSPLLSGDPTFFGAPELAPRQTAELAARVWQADAVEAISPLVWAAAGFVAVGLWHIALWWRRRELDTWLWYATWLFGVAGFLGINGVYAYGGPYELIQRVGGLILAVQATSFVVLVGKILGGPLRAAQAAAAFVMALTVGFAAIAPWGEETYGPLLGLGMLLSFGAPLGALAVAAWRGQKEARVIMAGTLAPVGTAAYLWAYWNGIAPWTSLQAQAIALGAGFGGFALAMAVAVSNHYARAVKERERLRGLFGMYVSEGVAKAVLGTESGANLGGEEREVTVVFADIRSYSTISEQLAPTEIVSMLNEYMGAMGQIVENDGGVVLEFLGDAILAVFGAPQRDPDHAEHAVACARHMAARLDELNDYWDETGLARLWKAAGVARLEARIGVHTGRVTAGNMGGARRVKYTVIGDAVNVASRVEGLNKVLGTHILATSTTVERLRPETRAQARDKGSHVVKGREQVVQVYTFDADAPAAVVAG